MAVSPGYSKKIVDQILAISVSNIDKLDWTGNNVSVKTCLAFLKVLQQQCSRGSLTLSKLNCEKYCRK